ncbi:MAG: hypothetical protein EBZ69_00955 [Alphaproteobacteria bacterium]|nr:hypothetical protein [Alphaproteobacteria bacterium]NDG03840.1 hypothetical protein [Alphaproteobacteria bacterium]
MESLAFLVAGLFLIFTVSGPAAVILAFHDAWIGAVICGLLAWSMGLHWFFNVTTSARYLGLLAALLGAFAAGVILRRCLSL